MQYTSTRNKDIRITPSQAIIRGISDDGGLYVPIEIPSVDNIYKWKNLSYGELAYEVMKRFLTDFSEEKLKSCIEKAYDEKFETQDIAQLKKVGDLYFLELFHGPTLAFKDMALSILPHLLREALEIQDVNKEVVILTATSGDTGKAALEGFSGVEGTKIVVFYPEDGVSKIQKLQMITQEGDNAHVVGIKGNFDDAQSGVKNIFNDIDLKEKLMESGYILSSANSINIGRLVPQIVYYFYSYLSLLNKGEINECEEINVSVPTGNFGNILAAYYAKKMGLPLNKLICASNENKILTDFFNTNIYDKRRDLNLTSSPSMDILVSSNLERLLYHLNEDEEIVKEAMMSLNQKGIYEVKDIDTSDFYGSYATEEETSLEIERIYEAYNYLIDTHTAVASKVYTKYESKYKDNQKTVIVSTASPFKFAENVASSIKMKEAYKDEFSLIDELSKTTGVPIPTKIKELKDKNVIHNTVIDKQDMKNTIVDFLGSGVKND